MIFSFFGSSVTPWSCVHLTVGVLQRNVCTLRAPPRFRRHAEQSSVWATVATAHGQMKPLLFGWRPFLATMLSGGRAAVCVKRRRRGGRQGRRDENKFGSIIWALSRVFNLIRPDPISFLKNCLKKFIGLTYLGQPIETHKNLYVL
jgi:hypothetical protein